ncbi:MAG: response regulator, partial [Lentisphaerae bacterium]|nr:response regulator [Lentisphaerota bacterium]
LQLERFTLLNVALKRLTCYYHFVFEQMESLPCEDSGMTDNKRKTSAASNRKHDTVVPVNRRRVLVADDKADIRAMFKTVLDCQMNDCRIDVVVNGAEAIEAFRHAHHGVLLMDVKMPVKDGIQVYEAIHKMCHEEEWEMPAFVFCTGFDAPQTLQNIVASNPNNCLLQKPVATDTLIEALRVRLDL